jgi:guanine deaminase
MQAYRASLLRFDAAGQPVFDQDGLLVVGPDADGRQRVLDAGAFAAVVARHPGVAVTHLPGRILAPGFIDLHIHFPQTDIIGSPSEGLLPWLENYTFPARGALRRCCLCRRRGARSSSTSCCATASPPR